MSGCFTGENKSASPASEPNEQKQSNNTKTHEQSEVKKGGAEGFFWEIHTEHSTVYLLGSFHMGIDEMYPMNKGVYDAFKQSDYLVLELDNTSVQFKSALEEYEKKQVYNDGTTLQESISDELYTNLIEVLPRFNLDINEFNNFKPWAVYILLEILWTEESNYDFNLGVEEHFLSKAPDSMKLKGLEDYFGLTFFDDLPEKDQEAMLYTIVNMILTDTKVKYPLEAWISGDLFAFEEWSNSTYTTEELERFTQKLIVNRNKIMAETINQFLESSNNETFFVIVGAAHFVGDQGIIQLLKDKGYNIQYKRGF